MKAYINYADRNNVWQLAVCKLLGISLGNWTVLNPYIDIDSDHRVALPKLVLLRTDSDLRRLLRSVNHLSTTLIKKIDRWASYFSSFEVTQLDLSEKNIKSIIEQEIEKQEESADVAGHVEGEETEIAGTRYAVIIEFKPSKLSSNRSVYTSKYGCGAIEIRVNSESAFAIDLDRVIDEATRELVDGHHATIEQVVDRTDRDDLYDLAENLNELIRKIVLASDDNRAQQLSDMKKHIEEQEAKFAEQQKKLEEKEQRRLAYEAAQAAKNTEVVAQPVAVVEAQS
jgi:hypothetical protein